MSSISTVPARAKNGSFWKRSRLSASPPCPVCPSSPTNLRRPTTPPWCGGQAQVVTDEGERTKALLLLVETLDPKGMGGLAACMERCFANTQIVKIVPRQITGKQSHPSPKPTFGCGEH